MYNEEIKNEFIKKVYESPRSWNTVKSRFITLGKLEEEYKKDICFIEPDIVARKIFSYTSILSYNTYYNYIYLLKQYIRWCDKHNKFPDHIFEIVYIPDELKIKKYYSDYIKTQIYKNFSDLHDVIDDIFVYDILDDGMRKAEYMQLYLLMLYEGVPEEEVFRYKLGDVKISDEEVKIKLNNMERIINDRQLVELLKKRKNVNYYAMGKGNRYDNVELSDYLIDFGSNDPEKTKTLLKGEFPRYVKKYNDLQLKSEYKINIKPFNIYACGLIRYIKEEKADRLIEIKKPKDIWNVLILDGIEPRKFSSGKRNIIEEIYSIWDDIT